MTPEQQAAEKAAEASSKASEPVPDTVSLDPISIGPESDLERFEDAFSNVLAAPVTYDKGLQMARFGRYLLERVFSKQIQSCTYDEKSQTFTIVFGEERQIPIKKLPQGLQQGVFAQTKDSTFVIAKTLRFKVNKDALEFEDGMLTLKWGWTAAHLTALKMDPANFGSIIFTGKYLGVSKPGPASGQTFVNLIECNLT